MTPRPPGDHQDDLVDLADDVRELTDSQLHVEKFVLQDQHGRAVKHDRHITRHPSLLDQLRAAGNGDKVGAEGAMAGGYESRPAARLEALDVLRTIASGADDWIVRHFTAESRSTIEGNLHALVGLAAAADTALRSRLAHDARSWLTLARVVTGWDSAPWRPRASCPVCEHVGDLRVRLDERVAACLHCKEAWTPATIGLLADHLREVNADARTHAQQRARLGAELDGFFPYRGPCLACAHRPDQPADARHRLMDVVVDLVLAGEREDLVAESYGLSVDAVLTAVAVATWTDIEPQAEERSA